MIDDKMYDRKSDGTWPIAEKDHGKDIYEVPVKSIVVDGESMKVIGIANISTASEITFNVERENGIPHKEDANVTMGEPMQVFEVHQIKDLVEEGQVREIHPHIQKNVFKMRKGKHPIVGPLDAGYTPLLLAQANANNFSVTKAEKVVNNILKNHYSLRTRRLSPKGLCALDLKMEHLRDSEG